MVEGLVLVVTPSLASNRLYFRERILGITVNNHNRLSAAFRRHFLMACWRIWLRTKNQTSILCHTVDVKSVSTFHYLCTCGRDIIWLLACGAGPKMPFIPRLCLPRCLSSDHTSFFLSDLLQPATLSLRSHSIFETSRRGTIPPSFS